jgi:RNA 2',3'-cyclic 3'-phosphodiesterase
MRFFVALDIPEQSRLDLSAIQQSLQQLVPSAKLTDPSKLHLTIAFVGDHDEKLKPRLIEILEKASEGISFFTVTPSYIDGFPHLHGARVLWVGVKDDIDKLYHLRHHVKDGLKTLGLPVDERRFVPHIALAKLNNFKISKEIEKRLEEIMEKQFSPIEVTSVKLFESIPEHGFHQHNTLAEIKLG